MSIVTAGRENGRRRPRGYANWTPHAATRVLLGQVEEILAEYEEHLPLTVRQIFYRLVGAYEYEKTENAYARLCEHLVRARRARILSFDSIRDDGVQVMSERWYAGQQDFLEEYARNARGYRADRQHGQRYRLELWSESAGMMPQLANIASKYSIPVYSNSGFASLQAVRLIVDRARNLEVPLVLMHVGDFDPSGESIFESMTADAIAFLAHDRILHSQQIIPVRAALTEEQIETYELSTTPAKASDSRSRRWKGETCQLEALAPDDLAWELEQAILQWIDNDRLGDELRREDEDRVALLRALPAGQS